MAFKVHFYYLHSYYSKYVRNPAQVFVFASSILAMNVQVRKLWAEYSVFDLFLLEE